MLISLARSQRALARMIEAVADQVKDSEQIAEHFTENLKLLSTYQRILAMKISGQKLPRKNLGTPDIPWINPSVETRRIFIPIAR